eukprot:scaffold6067_cov112-Isochrysis_galbana.AAC.13
MYEPHLQTEPPRALSYRVRSFFPARWPTSLASRHCVHTPLAPAWPLLAHTRASHATGYDFATTKVPPPPPTADLLLPALACPLLIRAALV